MQKKRWLHWTEELILVFLILTDVLDFFDVLPGDIDYITLIVTWTALGYLLYRISLTRVFFNQRNRFVDFLLIIAYFMLVVKNLIVFSSGRLGEYSFLRAFQEYIVASSGIIEVYSFITGAIIIMLLAVYCSFAIGITKPSLMSIMHEEGTPRTLSKLIIRIISVYIACMAFFIVVFNLAMEWIAISIDAPLLMLALLFYIMIIRRHKSHRVESLVYRLGELGADFYAKFISLFHYRHTIMLGISGMLALHLATDAINFILPYIVILRDTLYFGPLGEGHDALASLFLEQAKGLGPAEIVSLLLIYVLNTIGILFLLLLPSFAWYIAFSGEKMHISKTAISLVISGVAALITSPVFSILRIENGAFAGVDIRTHFAQNFIFDDFSHSLLLVSVIFIASMLLLEGYKRLVIHFILLKGILFFMFYTYLFSTSVFLYYIWFIRDLISGSMFFLAFNFLLFFAISILFYIAGFIMFVDEMAKEKVYKKIQ